MPSPIGHVLGGLAAGWLVAGAPDAPAPAAAARTGDPWWRQVVLFGLLGVAPDLDLLAGLHSRYTHSVGAAVLVVLVAWVWQRGRSRRWALACGAALASHVLLDWLGSDTTPPIGIMALWPFSFEFYQSALHLFPAVSRRYWQWSFVTQNARAVVWELALLGPTAWLAITRAERGARNSERTTNAERGTRR